jgi:hypothetical protein
MSNTPVLRHIRFKEIFCLLNLPNAKTGSIVDLLLKKNRHEKGFRLGVGDFRFKIAELSFKNET